MPGRRSRLRLQHDFGAELRRDGRGRRRGIAGCRADRPGGGRRGRESVADAGDVEHAGVPRGDARVLVQRCGGPVELPGDGRRPRVHV